MLYSNYIVMSFPFITQIEYDEKIKREKALMKSSSNPTNKNYSLSEENKKKSPHPVKEDCDKYKHAELLSNLEDVVFQTSSSKCLSHQLSPPQKNKKKIDYDKYLDFFE